MKKKETTSRETIEVREFEVKNVNQYKDTVFFNLVINGVIIYGCRVVEGQKGDFISFPSKKGNDGKYYNHAYAALSEEDAGKILAEVEKQLNE